MSDELIRASRKLTRELARLSFGGAVAYVYAPLEYARRPHELYLGRARSGIDALFVGMNPGPFGMAQTGVPFGEVAAVRDFLGLEAPVDRPAKEHPKRPVEGFSCTRSEVSGKRFWGLMRQEFESADAFFERAFVWNWCPLAFVAESGANLTPDKLPRSEQAPLATLCDDALEAVVRATRPRLVVGVGAFAAARARIVGSRASFADGAPQIATVLHPSPASPAANRGWEAAARATLAELGVVTAR